MHCQGHVRNSFLNWLDLVDAGTASIDDDVIVQDGESIAVTALLGRLHNCTDILPRSYYAQLDMGGMQTFAAAVRRVAQLRQ